jgi:hypothetical protein
VAAFFRGFGWLWDKTFNSVIFGICLMAALSLYIAIGSGFASVRAWLEMTEMQFFNWWPMPLMAAMLVVNLLTVSLNRIPFTLPRLGVWTIHLGIITLIFGMTAYFSQKVEGLSLIRKGELVEHFYDAHERSLYVNIGDRKLMPIPLATLPRFDKHSAVDEPEYFEDLGLTGLVPEVFAYDEERRRGSPMPLHESPGIDIGEGEPLKIDVVAFDPYAVVNATYAEGSGDLTAIRVSVREPATGRTGSNWSVAEQPGHPRDDVAEESIARLRFKHIHRTDELTGELLASAAREAHEIEWRVGGPDGHTGGVAGRITLEPGTRVPLGETGYELEAVAFLPGFPLFGNGDPVDAFELLVHPPEGEMFRRYVLDGRHLQTDFKLGVEGSGPKGQRQETPLDDALHLHYALADGLKLLTQPGEDERHTFLTKDDRPGYWHLVTRADQPAQLEDVPSGKLELELNMTRVDPETGESTPAKVDIDITRHDNVIRGDWVQSVPPEQRDEEQARAGMFQVVTINVRRGEWNQLLHVPFTLWPDQMEWQPAAVTVPGIADPVRFQLANTRRSFPARVRLDDFVLVPYAGDFTETSMMRDFKSKLTVDPLGGEPGGATVSLNYPHYFDVPRPGPVGSLLPDESWLLFQSQWDPEDQAFTVLGVANRPGILTMTVGCVMITLGLIWAFYVKPVIINRRKAQALAAAGLA